MKTMRLLARRRSALCALLAAAALAAGACDDGGSSPDPTPTFAPGATASFTSGVASGDVRPGSAVLWTHAEGGDNVSVEVARDEGFSTIEHSAAAVTSAARDYTVKVKIEGLAADARYYYRFRAGTDFYYLTGNQEPDCVLVLVPDGDGHRLFCEVVEDIVPDIWEGDITGVGVYVFKCGSCGRLRAHWDVA